MWAGLDVWVHFDLKSTAVHFPCLSSLSPSFCYNKVIPINAEEAFDFFHLAISDSKEKVAVPVFPGCGGVKIGTDEWQIVNDLYYAVVDNFDTKIFGESDKLYTRNENIVS